MTHCFITDQLKEYLRTSLSIQIITSNLLKSLPDFKYMMQSCC